MKLYTCTDKHYKNNSVDQYLLKDLRSDREVVVSAQELKERMRAKEVDVMNLTLTSDNKLIEAGKLKTDQIIGIMKAPSDLTDSIRPMTEIEINSVETLMDEILHDCIKSYVKEHAKYIKLEHFNKENNTCILEFTLGPNSFFMFSYDKICYGISDHPNMCQSVVMFDIAIKAVAVSNRKESLKIETNNHLLVSKIANEVKYNQLSKNAVCINMCENGDIDMEHVENIKKRLGRELLDYIRQVTLELCENNTNIIDNVNVSEYIEYDETRKYHFKDTAFISGFSLIGTVVFGGIIAASVALNPEIMQTALLAKIANIASPGQVIAVLSGGLGILGGATTTFKVLGDNIIENIDRREVLKNNPKDYKRVAREIKEHKEERSRIEQEQLEKKKSIFNMFKR